MAVWTVSLRPCLQWKLFETTEIQIDTQFAFNRATGNETFDCNWLDVCACLINNIVREVHCQLVSLSVFYSGHTST